jgi:hypothetical protein
MPRLFKVARGDKQRSDQVAQEQRAATEALGTFNLKEGDTVRFRRVEGGKWTTATVRSVNKDGSLQMYDSASRARSIPPECCETRRKGPRGGTLWVPVLETND